MEGVEHVYILDRMEEDWAIIETDKGVTFNLPRCVLPVDLKEGDVIKIQISIDTDATLQRSGKAKSLLNNFFDE